MDSQNKTVVVTGASSGIGKAGALLFAEKGWNVIATIRTASKDQDLNSQRNITQFALDVSDSSQIERVCNRIIKKYDRVDAVVNIR